MTSPVIALLTDFGLDDHYVGTVKSVLLKALPGLRFIDITHNIPAQSVAEGAFQLLCAYPYLPEGSLALAVVDPGVGTERKLLYAQTARQKFLGPDNGLLSWALAREKGVEAFHLTPALAGTSGVSQTFHARDLFAPLAAKLLNGENPASLGAPVASWVQLPFPAVEKVGSRWTATVLSVDAFGNMVTNVRTEELIPYADHSKIWIDAGKSPMTIRGLAASYAAVGVGRPLAIIGSSGFLEISVREGNAAQVMALKVGDPVTVHFRT